MAKLRHIFRTLGLLLVLVAPALLYAAERPRRVLIIHSFAPDFSPYAEVATSFRQELARLSPAPIEFMDASLEIARFDGADRDTPLLEFLTAVYREQAPDLLVPIGAQATKFCVRHREKLFPQVPILMLAADKRRTQDLINVPGLVSVGLDLDIAGYLQNILQVLPETKDVYAVTGTTPLEQFWEKTCREEWAKYSDRVTVHWLSHQSVEATCRMVGDLPPQSAVFVSIVNRDAGGVPYAEESALRAIHAKSRSPVFGYTTRQLGQGIVGGRLAQMEETGKQGAATAWRLLNGEPAEETPQVQIPLSAPLYDGRELKRWNIPQNALPPGATVHFQEPSLWQTHRTATFLGIAFVALQSIFIAGLLAQRAWRHRVEREVRELRQELAHAGRVSTLGQLATSLAHELNQPLGAILRNAEAAELFLQHEKPDLAELREIVTDIRKDDQRAGKVIDRLRGLLKRREVELAPVDLGELIEDVETLVHADGLKRHVEIAVDVPKNLPLVQADRVHLQQVLLNLMMNALDALSEGNSGPRTLTVRARVADARIVEIAVEDNGPGIPAEKLPHLFEPFFTTKAHGMGFGLSIARTIAEAHGGALTAGNRQPHGAIFRLTLPIKPGGAS